MSHPLYFQILKSRPPCAAKKGAKTRDSTAISLMRMLRDGPEVSLRGSPIVSPITAALCGSDPFGPRAFACSEAPACRPTINSRLSSVREGSSEKKNKSEYLQG